MKLKYVTLRTECRSDNGRDSYIVTWSPNGKRKRLTFSDLTEAQEEAQQIDDALRSGFQVLAETPKSELATAVMLRDESAPGVPLHEIVRFYLEHHTGGIFKSGTTAADACARFILSRSSGDDFSVRQIQSVRQHINRFANVFGRQTLDAITADEIKRHLGTIGTAGKTKVQHLITIKSFFRWARDIENILPFGRPTAADRVTPPKVVRSEHEVYTPEEFTRLLTFTPSDMIPFMVLGQFAGIRAAERTRLTWSHWRRDEDNKLVLNENVTKTNQRRRVDVLPNLGAWLEAFAGEPDQPMVIAASPHKLTSQIARAAGLSWKPNALRAGFASYHLELFDDAALTAKMDGHSVKEMEDSYKSISGVTKAVAQKMFNITPDSVKEYARTNGLPSPSWAV